MKTHEQQLGTAFAILEGLSVGDALGEALSYQHHRARELSDFSVFAPGSVRYTDDTEMALAVYETLRLMRGIDEDTVPFCIWSACRNLGDYREALLSTVEMGGDCDTNCAIVCGIVTAFVGVEEIPKEWLKVREPLATGCL